MNEVISDGENGFLISIRNPIAMAAALCKVAKLSIAEYQKMTIAARKTIENQHSHQRMIADMESLYESVLKEPS
jgi:colanic acid/amylovoran biosynthesis glycosyltransferase